MKNKTELLRRLAVLPVYLGSNESDVRNALNTGPAAMLLAPKMPPKTKKDTRLHLCFDWDSTLVTNECDELAIREGFDTFLAHEWENRDIPHNPGPMYTLLMALQGISDVIVSVLTARTGRSALRVMTTLESWGCQMDAMHFAGGRDKGAVAAAMQADVFFDNLRRHTDDAVAHGIYAGWVPYGNATACPGPRH